MLRIVVLFLILALTSCATPNLGPPTSLESAKMKKIVLLNAWEIVPSTCKKLGFFEIRFSHRSKTSPQIQAIRKYNTVTLVKHDREVIHPVGIMMGEERHDFFDAYECP